MATALTEEVEAGFERLPELNLTRPFLFTPEAVKSLKFNDFQPLGQSHVGLKHGGCYLVLFYTNNSESFNLARIWSLAGRQVVGPGFAAVNLGQEREIAQAFASLNTRGGLLGRFGLQSIPFILVYQNGEPVGFYNGDRSVQAIIDFALTMACRSDYFEPISLSQSMQSEYDYTTASPTRRPVEDLPALAPSEEISDERPLRGYSPAEQLVLSETFAPEEGEEGEEAGEEEAGEGEEEAGEEEEGAE